MISDVVRGLTEANQQYFCTACLKQSEEPTSQAVIAEEQMVEGLEKAKFLSQSKHRANGQDHGSVHEVVAEAPPPAEELQDLVRRPRPSVRGKEPSVKRLSMRSPARRNDKPPSLLRCSEEVIAINMDETVRQMPVEP